MLHDLVCSPVGVPSGWEPLQHNAANEATGGIWRVTGPGGTAVLKHATPGEGGSGHWAPSDDARHWNYWKREYLAYTTGAAERYGEGAGLLAPRLLTAGERPDGSAELWLEDVQGASGGRWAVEQFALFARRLGAAQARHAASPEQPWHSRRWLRQYASSRTFGDIDWDHPVAARHWPDELREGLRVIWKRRGDLFDRAEALPQTLCHLDVWPMNLLMRGADPVLLDWAFVGRGAVGEDVANLIADTFLDGLQPVDRLPEIP
ncbi:phosphotransferase, partial [Glycomyces tenuis]|uniref:phosphotransferase n=1 Tax=Glycomyces tenuis TaxID=58116 RepID=UPI000557BC2D